MLRQSKLTWSFLLLLILSAVHVSALLAQTETPPIIQNDAIANFPDNITFTLQVDDAFPLAEATLTYDVQKFTCLDVPAQVPVEVNGQTLTWTWVLSRAGNLPPGAALWWQWTLTDTNGNTFTTPQQTLAIADDQFEWQTVSAAGVQLYWYGDDEVGPTLLEAAVSGLDRLQNEMGIQLQNDVRFYIYDNYDDMREALLYVQDWAGAVAFDEHNIILMGVPPSLVDTWGRKTVSHELAHLVVGQFGRSCVGGRRPTWLEEGLAVYAEGEPQPDVVEDIEEGIEQNSFEPLRSLTGAFSAHDTEAGIAYSQSYSTVDFMLNEYGQEKMQELILTLAQGTNYDEALEQVYGLNMDELELAWRAAMGLPPRPIPPTPTPLVAAHIPTIVPLGAPVNVPTPPAAAATPPPAATEPEGDAGFCGAGALPLLLVGLVMGRRQDDSQEREET